MRKLENKIALVTGGSKGIGRGIAIELAAQGALVAINYNTDKTGAEVTAAMIAENGGKAMIVKANVADPAEVKDMFASIQSDLGKIDVLVNNAGVYQFAPIEAVTVEEYRREMDINVLGTMLCIQEAIAQFEDRGGSIVNISSVAATRAMPYAALYTATKAAVNGFTESLSKELGARNIRINSVLPGLTKTEGTISLGVIGTAGESDMVANTPLGRTGQPDDIAKAVAFLASEEANWITGQKVEATGGF